jgi:hypothetical protein
MRNLGTRSGREGCFFGQTQIYRVRAISSSHPGGVRRRDSVSRVGESSTKASLKVPGLQLRARHSPAAGSLAARSPPGRRPAAPHVIEFHCQEFQVDRRAAAGVVTSTGTDQGVRRQSSSLMKRPWYRARDTGRLGLCSHEGGDARREFWSSFDSSSSSSLVQVKFPGPGRWPWSESPRCPSSGPRS